MSIAINERTIIAIRIHHKKIGKPFKMKRASIATFSHKHSSSSKYGVRSISLPTRSHPTTVKVEEDLNKLRSLLLDPSSPSLSMVENVCFCLNGLSELYKSIEDLLKLPLTQQALAQHRDENWVNEFLDCPIRFLDLLGKTRDSILLMKGIVEDLQSAVRRRKIGNFGVENHISAYWSIRRNMKKECTKFMLLLKHVDESFGAFCNLDLNNHVCAIVRVLREASLVTGSVFQTLFVFLSSPILKSRVTKWDFVSRLVHKGVFSCNNQGESVNELEKVDLALSRLVMQNNMSKDDFSADAEKIQSAHRRLEYLVEGIEGIDNGLEHLFKHLINTRVCFLNILSPN